MSDEARDFLQGQVDSVYSLFVKAVAQQRGVSSGSVREGMGQGRSLLATDAVKAGLADRLGTLDSVLARLLGRPALAGGRPALEDDDADTSSLSLSHRGRQLALGCITTTNVPNYKQTPELRRRELELVAGMARPGASASVDRCVSLARRRRELDLL